MRAQLRSELVKLLTTRGVYGLTVGAWAVVALATWSTIGQLGAANVTGDLTDQPFFLISAVNLSLFAAVLGARGATEEFRYGTVVAAVLSTRHRGHVLAAKAVVAGLAGAVLAGTALALMTGLAVLLTSPHGGLQVGADDVGALAGITVATAVWGVLGTAVGVAVRHQVAAVVGVIVWILVVENLGAGLLGDGGRYLPGQAAQALAGRPDLLPTATAATLLAVYVMALLIGAHVGLTRRNI